MAHVSLFVILYKDVRSKCPIRITNYTCIIRIYGHKCKVRLWYNFMVVVDVKRKCNLIEEWVVTGLNYEQPDFGCKMWQMWISRVA